MAKGKFTTQNLFGETVRSLPPRKFRRRFAIGEANCLGCGKIFTVLAGNRRKQFCSHKCQCRAFASHASRCMQAKQHPKKIKVKYEYKTLKCEECKVEYLQKAPNQKYCSDVCLAKGFNERQRNKLPPKRCIGCKSEIKRGDYKELCSSCYKARRHKERRIRKHRHRAKKHGVKYEPINAIAVFDRDNWRCQVCNKGTPKHLRGTHKHNAPELDHRIPMALGGSHTWDNVQCCCRECNGKKGGISIKGQLPLFVRLSP